MSIGAFARRTRLSPKALRLYDELDLLAPARVDERSGYRFYDAGQLERARILAMLRQLGLPLAKIKAILALEPPAAAARLADYWASAESEHASRRQLAAYLVDRINGKRSVMYEVAIRDVPARSLLCLKRNVTGHEQAWAFGKEFIALLREHEFPSVEGPTGAGFCIFWSELSEDTESPIEWCRPVPEESAQGLVDGAPELTLRSEPAHREAFVDLGPGGETTPAQWQLVSESLHAWAEGKHLKPIDLGVRINYIVTEQTSRSVGPDCQLAVPFLD